MEIITTAAGHELNLRSGGTGTGRALSGGLNDEFLHGVESGRKNAGKCSAGLKLVIVDAVEHDILLIVPGAVHKTSCS